jgi:tetratricopeptide (TPR) repeat protein
MKFVLLWCVATCIAAGQAPVHIRAAGTAFKRAEAARAAHDWSTAEKQYLIAIDIEPTMMEAYRSLAELYIANNRPMDAGSILTRILQIEPSSSNDRLALGKILLDAGQPARALAQFGAALQISNDSDALYGFAQSARANGMNDRAMEAAATGIQEFPKDVRFKKLFDELRAILERSSK